MSRSIIIILIMNINVDIFYLRDKLLNKELPPLKFSTEFSNLFDKFFIEQFKTNFTYNKDFSILATGSYGREQLSPYSDLDVIFLLNEHDEEFEKKIIDSFIYPLWNLKMEIGYSFRTVEEFSEYLKVDLKEWSKTLDLRFICGNNRLFSDLNEKLSKIDSKNFIKDLFKENDERREKFGNTVYLLEPNIKNSPGGLRDINLIKWYSKLFKDDLNISDKEIKEIRRSQNYILTIRNILHVISQKENDNLTFDMQREVTDYLFPDKKPEFLMKKYYFSANTIDYYYEYIREKVNPKLFFSINYNKKIDKDFYIKNYTLFLKNLKKIDSNPELILKCFDIMQKYRTFPSFELKTALKKNMKHIRNLSFRKDIINLFFKILEREIPSGFYLKLMNQLNFFGYFIPEFKKIRFKITYDRYHKYTIDMHSIYSVIKLRELFNGVYINDYPFISALALNISNKRYVLFAALIHDIGKGIEGEGDHLIKGEIVAEKICERLNISEKNKNLVKYLVRNHTLMTDTALKRDIKNEEEVINFANKVKNVKNLNYLFLLSFADLNAVSDNSYDRWKNAIFQELYIKTFNILTKRDKSLLTIDEKIASIKSYAYDHIPQKEQNEFEKFLSGLSRRYILNKNEVNVVSLYQRLKNLKSKPEIIFEYDEYHDLYKIFLYSYNVYGVFNKVVGVLTLNNLNILSAEIYSNNDGTIIDIFYVKPIYDDIYFDEKIPEISKKIKEFISKKNLEKELEKKLERKIKIKHLIEPNIKFDNKDSVFFTIIEITSTDFPGLLYLITDIFKEFNIEIHSAKITTMGLKAIDTFYVTDLNGDKIVDKRLQENIKQKFYELI